MSYDTSSHISGSPSPTQPKNTIIPDDTILIQYESVDPTRVLDNPSNYFGETFFEEKVGEKIGASFVEMLLKYQELANTNMNITIQSVKHKLKNDDMKTSDLYDLLDKFYVDVPDIVSIDSSFVTVDLLPLFLIKHDLHKDIKKRLTNLSDTFQILLDNHKTQHQLENHYDKSHTSSDSEEDEKINNGKCSTNNMSKKEEKKGKEKEIMSDDEIVFQNSTKNQKKKKTKKGSVKK